MIRVLLADDHRLFREGLRMLLNRYEDIDVVAEVKDGDAVLPAILDTGPTSVLLDVEMPGPPADVTIRLLRRDVPEVKVIVVTMHSSNSIRRIMLSSGASALFDKSRSVVDLVDLLRSNTRIGEHHSSTLQSSPVLSKREIDVLWLIRDGATNGEIGARLSIALPTVKNHISNLFRRLGVSSRTEAVKAARILNLFGDNSPTRVPSPPDH